MKPLKIQILIDNINSWIIPYAKEFIKKNKLNGHSCKLVHNHQKVLKGDILILLSCEKLFNKLQLNKFNLIVHESDLPRGKGWSPITYQVLEGINRIPITLFEASKKFDGGSYYYKDFIQLSGNELIDEIRKKQAEKSFYLLGKFINNYEKVNAVPQIGKSSFYKRRITEDSVLDINKTIIENFNLLRVVPQARRRFYDRIFLALMIILGLL